MKKTLIAILIALFSNIFLFSSQALAEATQDKVAKFVGDIGDKIIKAANNKKLSETDKKNKIIAIIDGAIDSKWIARFVLGKNYRTANSTQRKRFTELYREFMINTYAPKFKDYNGKKFTVKKVIKQGRFYIAEAEFLPQNSSTPILFDFRVKERKGKLVILDFIAEDISLIETQRSEFNSAIGQSGLESFLDSLEKRVIKLKSQN